MDRNDVIQKELVIAIVLDAIIALGYLAYSAVLVVLACASLDGWRSVVALVLGTALFVYASTWGGIFDSFSDLVITGSDERKSERR